MINGMMMAWYKCGMINGTISGRISGMVCMWRNARGSPQQKLLKKRSSVAIFWNQMVY